MLSVIEKKRKEKKNEVLITQTDKFDLAHLETSPLEVGNKNHKGKDRSVELY